MEIILNNVTFFIINNLILWIFFCSLKVSTENEIMSHLNLRFNLDSPRASAMLCPSLAREGRNVRFADVGVSIFKIRQ